MEGTVIYPEEELEGAECLLWSYDSEKAEQAPLTAVREPKARAMRVLVTCFVAFWSYICLQLVFRQGMAYWASGRGQLSNDHSGKPPPAGYVNEVVPGSQRLSAKDAEKLFL